VERKSDVVLHKTALELPAAFALSALLAHLADFDAALLLLFLGFGGLAREQTKQGTGNAASSQPEASPRPGVKPRTLH
jgi:hypothetical protein